MCPSIANWVLMAVNHVSEFGCGSYPVQLRGTAALADTLLAACGRLSVRELNKACLTRRNCEITRVI